MRKFVLSPLFICSAVCLILSGCALFKPIVPGQESMEQGGSGSTIYTSSIKHWKNTTRALIVYSTKPSQKTLLSFNGNAQLSNSSIQKTVRGPISILKRNQTLYVYNQSGTIIARTSKALRVTPLHPHIVTNLNNRSYRGSIHITPKDKDTLAFINHVPSEDYLRGVVPSEMPAREKALLESLKAQAVAARTYLLARFERPRDKDFDVYSDTRDQVYKGLSVETYFGDKAVMSTKRIVALYKSKPITCYYHSTCGGHTANIENVWNGVATPYLRSKRDHSPSGQAYCKPSRLFEWKEQWSRSELTHILNQYLRTANATFKNKPLSQQSARPFKKLRNIKITKRTPSGRVQTLKIDTEIGSFYVRGDKIRWALRRNQNGYPILWSSHINIQFGNTIRVSGKGFGHGIGMCQMGAMGRSRAGHDFKRILRFYYSGIQLVKANS